MTAELDPLSELRFLTEALREHAEWQQACGSTAVPRGSDRAPDPRRDAEPVLVAPLASGWDDPLSLIASAATVAGTAPALVAAPISQAGRVERHQRLALLAEEVRSCRRCGLHVERTQTVFARGSGASGLCFVGEGPGVDEDAQGFPFVGPAGQLLDKMIAAMGLERDDVYVCNIVKCRPPENRTPEPDEMSACMPYLAEQIALVEPQVIVALGKTAVQGLFGSAEGITRIRGRWRLYQGRIAVMPTFHPAYLLRNPAAKRDVWSDLQTVLKQLGRALPTKGT